MPGAEDGRQHGALESDAVALLPGAGATGCENCATFNGDYTGLAYGPDGHANMAWTDMRDQSDIAGLYSQFAYYAQH